jgi:ribonuclease BN (tRNA processing enzyme)
MEIATVETPCGVFVIEELHTKNSRIFGVTIKIDNEDIVDVHMDTTSGLVGIYNYRQGSNKAANRYVWGKKEACSIAPKNRDQ